MPLLETINLSKSFGGHKVLKDINLTITEGEALGLMGESGSGKSTLARILLKLIPPTSGEIKYSGIEKLRKDCQIVFQDPHTSLNPRIKIGEAVGEPLSIHKILPKDKIKDRVMELLNQVNLGEKYYSRYPHALSGGERQRIGIARAIASNPKFLILDEPVSSLDLVTQVQILKLLKEMRKKLGLTYLFIAHDILTINFLCNRVITIKNGQLPSSPD